MSSTAEVRTVPLEATRTLDIHDFDIRTYRVAAVIGGAVFAAFGVIQRMGHPEFVDPIPLRVSVVAICFALAAATLVSDWARRRVSDLAFAIYVAVTVYAFYTAFQNRFSVDTLIGATFTFAVVSIAIRRRSLLLAYIALTVTTSAAVAVAAHGVAHGGGALLGMALGFGAISFLLQRSRQGVEERLAASEEGFRSLVEGSAEIITVIAPDGTVLYDSPAVARTLGYSAEERVGTSILDYVHPDDVSTVGDALRDQPMPPPVVEVRGRHKDGSWRVFHCRAHPTEVDGVLTKLIVTTTDITARKDAEVEREALVRERESLIRERERALDQVKRLSGLLPICAKCKRTRDDKGYWEQLDEYLAKHSDIQISHGICPTCARELYGDLVDEI